MARRKGKALQNSLTEMKDIYYKQVSLIIRRSKQMKLSSALALLILATVAVAADRVVVFGEFTSTT